jgi:2-hydroxychromene-2-carboxylate isomerase
MATLRFLFDVGSPTAYLAWKRLPKIIERTGATVDHVPILLGGIFKATGNAPPGTVAAKGRWMNDDMATWAKRDGTSFQMNPKFPINTTAMMRGCIAAQDRGEFQAYTDAVFHGMWRDAKDMGDLAVLGATIAEAGLDAAAYAAALEDQAVKDKLRANTEAAVAAGVFGAPSFFVGDRLFFGQDRTDFVELALKGEL